jgi:hypothetical protein
MNKNIDFDVSESAHFNGRDEAVETLSFMWGEEGVHLAVYEIDDLRGAVRKSSSGQRERADIAAVRALIAEQEAAPKENAFK